MDSISMSKTKPKLSIEMAFEITEAGRKDQFLGREFFILSISKQTKQRIGFCGIRRSEQKDFRSYQRLIPVAGQVGSFPLGLFVRGHTLWIPID